MNEAILSSLEPTDETLLVLSMHFGQKFKQAIEIVDLKQVQQVVNTQAEIFIIHSHLVSQQFCNCFVFQKLIINGEKQICQHILAVHIAKTFQIFGEKISYDINQLLCIVDQDIEFIQ
ncbi:hypothetical protein SS50377_24684 [Spironucleus salmonicida]|uniref:SWIM-type domain-containing protein n=1 Tax=Spironucleus salmonicida TaxID=348837 RepID=V6LIV4_9EUKA|nr:hypothetical protein SS50377_24684 [Spironucleus salmonicida]|eukprot:EST44492.1 hypothetical protein SS50377_15490 [Spironucleus salmonicida]